MKMHVRILYAVAVVALVASGFALKSGNDELASKLASKANSSAPNTGSTP